MKNDNNDRRNFLKTAGAALLAVSVPATIAAQTDESREYDAAVSSRREEVYLFGFGWDRNLPGVFGQACFGLELLAELDVGGFGTLRDDVYAELNSQFQIDSAVRNGRRDINDIYVFRGSIGAARSPEMIGKRVIIRSQVLDRDGNCRVSLTIEDTPVAIGLLLPAVQTIRVPIYG